MSPERARVYLLPRQLGLGGPASFQAGLRREFKELSVSITDDPLDEKLDAILVFGATRGIGSLRRAQKAGVRVVQRLNGMNWVHRRKYTGVRHFIKAEVGNLKLRSVRKLANGIIYQSNFSREWWDRVHGKVESRHTVIYNGVDVNLFSPDAVNLPEDHTRLLMIEGHHGGGYEQGLETGSELARRLARVTGRACELMVVGDVPATLQKSIDNNGGWVTWLGVVKHEEIPAIDRSAHLFFSADINAACPNSVLEAMACGLPVVAYDTGAMKELVEINTGRLADFGGNVWKLEPPSLDNLVGAARQVLESRENLSRGARDAALLHFDIKQIARRYLDFLLN